MDVCVRLWLGSTHFMCYSAWHRTLHFPNEYASEIAVHIIARMFCVCVRDGFCVSKNEFECVINDLKVYAALRNSKQSEENPLPVCNSVERN